MLSQDVDLVVAHSTSTHTILTGNLKWCYQLSTISWLCELTFVQIESKCQLTKSVPELLHQIAAAFYEGIEWF